MIGHRTVHERMLAHRDIQIDLPVGFSALLRWPATKDNFVLVEIIIGETIELKLLV